LSESLRVKLRQIPVSDFDLEKTLDSGQVFHWQKSGKGFVGTIDERPIYVEQRGNTLRAKVASASSRWTNEHGQDAHATISRYFALDHPLGEICASLPNDPAMNAAKDFCRGLRIIRQPKWECLATFICSSMKQVAHIRQISLALRQRFGEARAIELPVSDANATGGSAASRAMPNKSGLRPPNSNIERRSARSTIKHVVYTFPSAEQLAQTSEVELRKCALGYRAQNLLKTAKLVAHGDVDLEDLTTLSDAALREALCDLPGVGAKVANCVMLFAYERLRAFPVDVWIERVLRDNYFSRARKLNAGRLQAFTQRYFGNHGGYAQQYLFHYARTAGGRRAVGAHDNGTRRRVSLHDKTRSVT
jgi:N-glycosylase/DNA lyase